MIQKRFYKFFVVLLLIAFVLGVFGCAQSDEYSVTVESVADICGVGSTGLNNRFIGVVVAQDEQNITKDSDRTIAEVFVAEGDSVNEGDVLFTYDNEQIELSLDKQKLELEQLQYSKTAKEEEKATLEKQAKTAAASQQLSYTLSIREAETAIREAEYNITLKEKEIANTEASLEKLEVTAPFTGKVQAYNPNGGYDNQGNELPFMTIIATGNYRVKGQINEDNAGDLSEGLAILIRSRVDESTWNGVVEKIDWESGQQAQSDYYEDSASSELTASTKYDFYVSLDDCDGLLLGQHVYIEKAVAEESVDGLALPSYYVFDYDGETGYVYAEGSNSKLEKRKLTIAAYNEESDTYTVTAGLEPSDFIAYPDESINEGDKCSEYVAEIVEDYSDEYYEEESYEFTNEVAEDGGF